MYATLVSKVMRAKQADAIPNLLQDRPRHRPRCQFLPKRQQLEHSGGDQISGLRTYLSLASSCAPAESSCLTQFVLSQANATCNAVSPSLACHGINIITTGVVTMANTVAFVADRSPVDSTKPSRNLSMH